MSNVQDSADTVVVFTARSPDRILREGGSQAWKLDPVRAKNCTWLVCAQNQNHKDVAFSDATEPHGSAFLIGKISAVRQSTEEGDDDRWMIVISEFARIDIPALWANWRNPVKYLSFSELGINLRSLKFKPVPASEVTEAPTQKSSPAAPTKAPAQMLTIAEAKKALALTFGVKPDAIEITVRG